MQSLVLCFLTMAMTACTKEECRSISSVYDVYSEAVIYPESFDQYVLDNQDRFNADYFSCLNDQIDMAEEVVSKAKQHCDDTFLPGSLFWNQCYDDIVDHENYLVYLETLKIVTADDATLKFSETPAYFYLTNLKGMDPSAYESLLIQNIHLIEDQMACTYCEKRCSVF